MIGGAWRCCAPPAITLFAAALMGCDNDRPSQPEPPAAPAYQLVFEDGFDGDALDRGSWTIAAGDGCPELCGGGARALRVYAPERVTVGDGALRIAPGAAAGSAGAVHTAGKFSFQYGRLEVSARLPAGAERWPAIRLLPADRSRYGALPSAGEIALAEGVAEGGVRSLTRYGLPVAPFHGAAAMYDVGQAPDQSLVEYAVEWDWGELRFFLNGERVHTQSSDEWYAYYPADAQGQHDPHGPYQLARGTPPFDQPFHLAIEFATAGGADAAALEVDAVRVYQCAGEGGAGCGEGDAASPLRDGAGGPLEGRNTANPYRERLELFAGGLATVSAPVDGVPMDAMLIDGTWAAPNATVRSDPLAADPASAGKTVWGVSIAGGAGEAFLGARNLSQRPGRMTGFNFSGHRLPGPGSEPVGELAFDLLVREMAADARLSAGLDSGFPGGPRVELPAERLGRNEWREHSVKFDQLAQARAGCCGLGLDNVTRPFVFRAEGGEADVLIDNVRVTNACKIVGGCGVEAAEVVARRRACTADGGTLRYGFYAYFAPVSYSADPQPENAGFNAHRGYEADLLTALEAMHDAALGFTRHPIIPWPGIWLRSVQEFDVVGGGITILDSRTRNAAGEVVVRFTDGHIAFRQSLLVRTEDAARLSSHDRLTSDVRVGALAGTTGEARLLQLTGLADADGALAAGTRVETATGTVVADGSAAFRITSSGATPNVAGRRRLHPPNDAMPQVIYLGDQLGEAELLSALGNGEIDAVARGEIGNSDAAAASAGRFAVTALDPQSEFGGFTVAAGRAGLLACLNDRIRWLTDDRRIGYAQWLEDPHAFMQRAEIWNQTAPP